MAIALMIACCISGAAALRVAPSALRPLSPPTRGGMPVAVYGAEAAGSAASAAADVAQQASLLVADVMTDTIMDIAVYTLLAGVLGLTVYSVRRPTVEAWPLPAAALLQPLESRHRGCFQQSATALLQGSPRRATHAPLPAQVFVTVDEGNRQAGGWQKREGEDEPKYKPTLGDAVPTDVESRLRSGAVYDPVKDEWTFKEAEKPAAARSAAGGGGSEINRYERRARSKAKAKERTKSKKK